MDINDIIDRIGIIRTRANLSARALSLAIGKSDGYIHLLETSRKFRAVAVDFTRNNIRLRLYSRGIFLQRYTSLRDG